jgi:CheY-like chemotaxis protein
LDVFFCSSVSLVDFLGSFSFNTRISARASERCVILLVDDNEADVLLTRQAFAAAHITNPLFSVSDGEEAVLYLEGFGPFANRAEFPLPQVVLLDLEMPKINGFRVLKWVRGHEHFKSLPVVVLSGSSDERDVAKAYQLGANSYLVKPSDFDALRGMMQATASFWLHHSLCPELKRRPRWGRRKE